MTTKIWKSRTTNKQVDRSLSELISLSRFFGADFRLVWAGGGNISVKTDDGDMFIKASGTELGRMTPKQGWRKVNLGKVRRLLDNLLQQKSDAGKIKTGLLKTCRDEFIDAPMPSIETFFHALLGRYVIHLHPMAVLPFLCSQNGQGHLREILSPKFKFHWIDFRGLGVVTAGQIQRLLKRKKLNLSEPHILFLANHGLIVTSNSYRQARKMVGEIVACCDQLLSNVKFSRRSSAGKAAITAGRIQSVCQSLCGFQPGHKTIPVRPLHMPEGIPPKAWLQGVITPEELTYLGGGIVWLAKTDFACIHQTIQIHRRKIGLCPMAFFVPAQGLFIRQHRKKLPIFKKIHAGYLKIRMQAIMMGGLKPLACKYLAGEGF